MKEWARMTEKFSEELKRFQMVCYYCAELMDSDTINENCPINTTRSLPRDCKNY